MPYPVAATPRASSFSTMDTDAGSLLPMPLVDTRESDASPVARPISVFLADDHAIVREGLRTLIESQSEMTFAGEATDGTEALRRLTILSAEGNAPDVMVMDVSMPNMGGVEATTQLHETLPHIKVLVLSMHEDRSYLRSLLEAGAAGYVLKRSAATELVRAIHTVMDGSVYLDPALTATVTRSFVEDGRAARGPRIGALPSLSEREESVMRLIAQGYANKEIAAQLHFSVKTVETYKARSMEKLELDSRVDLIHYALAQGWLQ